MELSEFQKPVWHAFAGTVAGYAVVLAIVFVTLFAVPYLLFSVL